METQEFHDKMIEGIAALKAGQKNVLDRVNKINGSVKELYNRTEQNARAILTHESMCPLKEEVKKIIVDMSTFAESHPSAMDVNARVDKLEETMNNKFDELSKLINTHVAERAGSDKLFNRVWPLILVVIVSASTALITLIAVHANSFIK